MMCARDSSKIELVPVKKLKPDGSNTLEDSVLFIEQFVKEVVDFSSQYGSNISISYTAYNIAGNPCKFPDYGDFPQAFVMRTYGKWWDIAPSKSLDYMPQNNEPIISHDYIDLEYHREVYPVRVSVYETYNPGSVIAIWARDADTDQWLRLWNGPSQVVAHKPRIFSPPLQLCNFKTKMLRLEFNHSQLEYYTALDAVLLIGTSELLIPNVGFQTSLSSLLKKLGGNGCNNDDCYNLTPDYRKVNRDLKKLKSTLHKHCVLFKSKYVEKVPKERLAAKMGWHCHYIPPIEEAFNSIHKFLQEDFPNLIKDINISSSSIIVTESQIEAEINKENNTCGSFSALPDETILKIFNCLDLKSLSRCSQVNRHFNNIAQDAFLYTSVNLKPYWYCVDASVLNNFVSKCQYLQRLDLSWCGNYGTITAENFIAFLQSNGTSLTHLRLNCCRFVDDFVIKKVSWICKNLKELCLKNCTAISDYGFAHLADLKNLERLELYRTSIETANLCSILQHNLNIRHLNLASMHDQLNMDDIAIHVAVFCQKIETLDFWKAQTLTVKGIGALSYCTHLKEVDFGWCSGIGAPGDSLRLLFSSCTNLEKVFLTSFRGLTDRDLEPLLLCKNLKQLDLLGARSISRQICMRLLDGLQLDMLDLSFCDEISDDAILHMRKDFPKVEIKRIFQVSR